jgi:hypothetical protein
MKLVKVSTPPMAQIMGRVFASLPMMLDSFSAASRTAPVFAFPGSAK